MLRNGTGSCTEFVKERNWSDFNRQIWWVVVNIQNISVLLQHTGWDTLLLSHSHPSEPKEVYQYLDALEAGRFELHVPVSGDLKENKKQRVKHHNSELGSCSYSTEKGTQWPSRYPGGWELLEHNCLTKPCNCFRQGLCSRGCWRTSAPATGLALNWYSLLRFKVGSSRGQDTDCSSISLTNMQSYFQWHPFWDLPPSPRLERTRKSLWSNSPYEIGKGLASTPKKHQGRRAE